MIVHLIRHGKTAGNLAGKYIGTTDEDLCREGASLLLARDYPKADLWFASPMKRCIQSVSLMDRSGSNRKNPVIVPDFRECDFGRFENRNYLELTEDEDLREEYQRWIDSNAALPFPGGEDPVVFRERCCRAFAFAVKAAFLRKAGIVNMVVHGGTIMSIMERYARPSRDYFDWRVNCGEGYCLEFYSPDCSDMVYTFQDYVGMENRYDYFLKGRGCFGEREPGGS